MEAEQQLVELIWIDMENPTFLMRKLWIIAIFNGKTMENHHL